MKDFVNDIQNLIVKHWGKLILLSVLVFFIVSFTFNYNDVARGFNDGYKFLKIK
jgi:hypothetical protein